MIGNHNSVKGGITSVIEQLLEHRWDEDQVEMSFIPTYIETNNIRKVCYFGVAYLRILLCLLLDRPDVVHIHMSYKGSFHRKYAIHKLCKLFCVKDIIHLHGSEFQKWFISLTCAKQNKVRKMLRECGCFIVLGEKWKSAVLEIEPQTNVVVVSNTVKIPNEIVKWNDNVNRVLFMGVLIKRKGVVDLLKAIHLLKEQDKLQNIQFMIAGTGNEETVLKEMAEQLKIEQYVKFCGWISGKEKSQLFQTCQMLVLPSYNEGLPIAILEAASYGMPVVATDVGDISAAIRDGKNGYLINPGDVEGLAEKMIKILECKDVYEKMSNESRRLIEEKFSESMYFEKINACYLNDEE